MIRDTHTLGETQVTFRVPETTADVLQYRAFILSMETDRAILHAAEWAADHIVEPAELAEYTTLLNVILKMQGEGQQELVRLCSAIAQSAMLPADVLDDLGKMLDLQNDIDPAWRPKPKCDCVRCRRPEVAQNPEGVTCMYDEISPAAINLASVAAGIGDGAASDPYFLTQVRAVVSRSTSRMYAKQREDREAEAAEQTKWDEFRRQHGANV